MRIAVCVKQVPTTSARMDQISGMLLREEANGTINPCDLCAIEAALRTAEATGSKVTAISMGPASAEAVLRDALAMGASIGVLLCDKAFSGADVYATAFTLAQGIKMLGGFDLMFCGQQTTDGDTAQLPFSLAVQLNARVAGWVKRIANVNECEITVLQELSCGTQRLTLPFPAVVAVGREAATPRVPSLINLLMAKKAEIRTLSLCNLSNQNAKLYGLAASPTRVIRIFENVLHVKADTLNLSSDEAAMLILREISEVHDG